MKKFLFSATAFIFAVPMIAQNVSEAQYQKAFVFEGANSFSEGLAPVKYSGKWGFIDNQGNVAIPFMYEGASSFGNGLAPVKLNDKWGYVNQQGNVIIPFKYESAGSFGKFAYGIANVELNRERIYIDTNDKEYSWMDVSGMRGSSGRDGDASGLTPDYKERKWGYVDAQGHVVIPYKYEKAGKFHNGFAEVELGRKKGFVDMTGKEVVPLIYEKVYDFEEGRACVTQNRRQYGFVDEQGNVVVPMLFEPIEMSFSNGFVPVRLNGRTGFVDTQGNPLRVNVNGNNVVASNPTPQPQSQPVGEWSQKGISYTQMKRIAIQDKSVREICSLANSWGFSSSSTVYTDYETPHFKNTHKFSFRVGIMTWEGHKNYVFSCHIPDDASLFEYYKELVADFQKDDSDVEDRVNLDGKHFVSGHIVGLREIKIEIEKHYVVAIFACN